MLAEILSLNIFHFLLVFARLGGAIMLFPGLGATYVPVRVRLLVALTIAAVTLPLVGPALPELPKSSVGLGLLMIGEVLIGVFFGAMTTFIASALHAAGTVIAFTSGMANALVYDPVSQQQSSLASGFLINTAIVLLFITDLHHLMLRAVIESYVVFVPGTMPMIEDSVFLAVRTLSDSFRLGVQLVAPFIILSFGFNLLMGLLARLMPQFPVFFVGLPLQQILSFLTMIVTLSMIMMVYLDHFAQTMGQFVSP